MEFIPIDVGLALSTLGDETVLSGALITFGEDFFVVGMKGVWSLRGLTAGDAPIKVGVAHGDLSDTEIDEALEAGVTDPDDIIARERSRRPVRTVGIFGGFDATEDALNDGAPMKTTCKFSVGDTHSLDVWAKNLSGAQLQTGASVRFNGVIYGRWQR